MKRQASKFYPYFNPEEKPVIDKMTGFFNQVMYSHVPLLTDFLNPGERDILRTIAGKELSLQEFGGYLEAEKKRVFLFEDGQERPVEDYEITACELTYPLKFAHLSHSAILGSLANSGIKTDTFGDIITDGSGTWQIFVKSELAPFLQQEVQRIGRVQVKIKPIPLAAVLVPCDDSISASIVVPSLRLDAVLAGISKKSRGQVKSVVNSNLVKLNWHRVQDSNIMVKVNDLISLRHFGRCQIIEIVTTRKGKFKVVLKLWQTKKQESRS